MYRSVILTFRAAAGVEPLSAAWSFEEYMSLRFIFKQHVSGGLVVQSHWEHVRLKVLPPVRVDGREGGQVVLTCSATGSPAPSIAWYKVGNPPHPPTVQITRLVHDPNYKKTDFSGRHMWRLCGRFFYCPATYSVNTNVFKLFPNSPNKVLQFQLNFKHFNLY